jgi:hypothetical protein
MRRPACQGQVLGTADRHGSTIGVVDVAGRQIALIAAAVIAERARAQPRYRE